MTESNDLAEIIAISIRDHRPTTGMRVASGETCRCGYWNGNERAGKDRPVGCGGLMWHQAQEAAAALVAAGYIKPGAWVQFAEQRAEAVEEWRRKIDDLFRRAGFGDSFSAGEIPDAINALTERAEAAEAKLARVIEVRDKARYNAEYGVASSARQFSRTYADLLDAALEDDE